MVMAVIGILVALVVPAVQQARESARRTFCISNLRQLGAAMHAYHDTHRFLPPGNSNSYSTFVVLLPHLEHGNLYLRVDLSRTVRDPQNQVIANTQLSILQCPSDAGYRRGAALTCYVVNGGTGLHVEGHFRGMFTIPAGGEIQGGGWISMPSVTDGLSHTAAFSELLVGDGSIDSRRIVGSVKPGFRDATKADEFVKACQEPSVLTRPVGKHSRGYPWINGNHPSTIYNHVAPPNHRACTNGGSVPDGSFPAASLHGGGVNVCLGDGSTRYVSAAVDAAVWRGVGSRDANDSVADF